MNPIYFGQRERTLFGIYDAPVTGAGAPRRVGVVLCNPFGHEASRAQRAFRQLAGLLSRARFHVLRFDYFATGDSAGDTEDIAVSDWVADVGTAIDELKDTSGVGKVWLVGWRYGATLALLAARTRTDVAGLLCWDPIVDGAAYLRELSRAHLEYLRAELPEGRTVAATELEALGRALGPALRASMAKVDLSGPLVRKNQKVVLVTSQAAEVYRTLEEALKVNAASLSVQTCPQANVWNSPRTMDAALIPPDVLQMIVGQVVAGEQG